MDRGGNQEQPRDPAGQRGSLTQTLLLSVVIVPNDFKCSSFLQLYEFKTTFVSVSSPLLVQTLDFSLEDRLSLVDLTLALDNELLVSGNGIHQAALISYKNEIQHLQ